MDDQTVEIVREIGDANSFIESANATPHAQNDRVEENTNSTDASQYSNESQAVSVDEEPKLPILKKINELSNKIQTLRKEHTSLSVEVKEITSSQFPGFEVLNTLQHLSEEHEVLKNKYMEESELLKKKYIEEYAERKRLYNEVIELKGNIRVFCRCRPLNQDERASGSTSVVEIPPSQDHELNITCADSSKKQFKFDHVFGPQADQEEVFAQTSPIVTSVLDGYNVCIFAYGQTGTGKTFTMEGTPENRGVNYRTLEELFRIANQRSGTVKYELFVSMLEVYNEKIRDLLVENTSEPPKKLEIKQAPEGTQEIPGLVEAHVYGTDEVWELLKTGSRVRSVGSTNANEFSSRSHCLLRITVKGENLMNGQRTKSNLWLVDLAGSERVGRIEVEGERLKESQFINKSLSALGDVISALATKTNHVPYRNSKLTHMLQSSLGGDCKTLMFVQISPSDADVGETLCSLNFASRVKGIEYGPARKQADISELLKYKHLAEKLKHDDKETKKLQDSVQSLQLRLSAREHICRSLQEKVRDLENQLAEERKTRQKQENRAAASIRQPRQAQKTTTERKPPLGPSNSRMPLRKICNYMPQPSPVQAKKTSTFSSRFSSSYDGKENTSNGSNTRAMRGPRRISVAVRPSTETMAPMQPRRRVSMATLRPESNYHQTPLSKSKRESALPGPSFFREASRVRRFSKPFSPLPSVEAATPMSSRRFMASPPQQGSWRPKHPTVVALQKKPVVWSPLKLRGLKNFRKSLV
ncbi:kinesin-like protein KIN-14S [Chenopodium quinoa]|uniref:kinesin-like protein KIN-14S n=1 Tax=Chenopodium quinoa TaxID=63459 RepID=UPI000B77C103|nr:kinesin-like protein KIN-14S [Chenopodium quinoa]